MSSIRHRNYCDILGCKSPYIAGQMFRLPPALLAKSEYRAIIKPVCKSSKSAIAYVCGKHFVDGAPTRRNPYPKLQIPKNAEPKMNRLDKKQKLFGVKLSKFKTKPKQLNVKLRSKKSNLMDPPDHCIRQSSISQNKSDVSEDLKKQIDDLLNISTGQENHSTENKTKATVQKKGKFYVTRVLKRAHENYQVVGKRSVVNDKDTQIQTRCEYCDRKRCIYDHSKKLPFKRNMKNRSTKEKKLLPSAVFKRKVPKTKLNPREDNVYYKAQPRVCGRSSGSTFDQISSTEDMNLPMEQEPSDNADDSIQKDSFDEPCSSAAASSTPGRFKFNCSSSSAADLDLMQNIKSEVGMHDDKEVIVAADVSTSFREIPVDSVVKDHAYTPVKDNGANSTLNSVKLVPPLLDKFDESKTTESIVDESSVKPLVFERNERRTKSSKDSLQDEQGLSSLSNGNVLKRSIEHSRKSKTVVYSISTGENVEESVLSHNEIGAEDNLSSVINNDLIKSQPAKNMEEGAKIGESSTDDVLVVRDRLTDILAELRRAKIRKTKSLNSSVDNMSSSVTTLNDISESPHLLDDKKEKFIGPIIDESSIKPLVFKPEDQSFCSVGSQDLDKDLKVPLPNGNTIKRSIGRPRKSKVINQSTTTESEESLEESSLFESNGVQNKNGESSLSNESSIKRPRGRPRKPKTTIQSNVTDSNDTGEANIRFEEAKKRPVGRPRTRELFLGPKRKRGRPPKDNPENVIVDFGPKRKRGRPAKSAEYVPAVDVDCYKKAEPKVGKPFSFKKILPKPSNILQKASGISIYKKILPKADVNATACNNSSILCYLGISSVVQGVTLTKN